MAEAVGEVVWADDGTKTRKRLIGIGKCNGDIRKESGSTGMMRRI